MALGRGRGRPPGAKDKQPRAKGRAPTSTTWVKGQSGHEGHGEKVKYADVTAGLDGLLPGCVERLKTMLESGEPEMMMFAIKQVMAYRLAKPAPVIAADELVKIREMAALLGGS